MNSWTYNFFGVVMSGTELGKGHSPQWVPTRWQVLCTKDQSWMAQTLPFRGRGRGRHLPYWKQIFCILRIALDKNEWGNVAKKNMVCGERGGEAKAGRKSSWQNDLWAKTFRIRSCQSGRVQGEAHSKQKEQQVHRPKGKQELGVLRAGVTGAQGLVFEEASYRGRQGPDLVEGGPLKAHSEVFGCSPYCNGKPLEGVKPRSGMIWCKH